MPPNLAASDPGETMVAPPNSREEVDSLFERVAWLYAFCREHLFRDDTNRMIAALWQNRPPPSGIRLIELGCGPGFYSRKLAQRFSNISVIGVDRSHNQLRWARHRAARGKVTNCAFARVNVLGLPFEHESFDVLVASRIFTVLPQRDRAVAEMFRVLKTGGRCFVAEPRFAVWASLPLFSMWLLASVWHSDNDYREPRRATVLSSGAFADLFCRHPWKQVKIWQDGRYQYAVCEKG